MDSLSILTSRTGKKERPELWNRLALLSLVEARADSHGKKRVEGPITGEVVSAFDLATCVPMSLVLPCLRAMPAGEHA